MAPLQGRPAAGNHSGWQHIEWCFEILAFGIRPEDIADALNVADPDPAVCADAKVEVSEPMGAETFLYLESGAHSFIAKVHSGDKYDINQDVQLRFDMDKAHLFDPETEKVLRA